MPRGAWYAALCDPSTGAHCPARCWNVWQADDAGFYDTQQPDRVPERNLSGLFTTNAAGEFWFRTIVPRFYPIPDDGPVGRLLSATHRHPNRAAHIHFIGSAEGFTPVVTHLFVEGSPYLDNDAVFGVKKSLIREVQRVDDPALARSYGVANPFGLIEFDVALDPILSRLAPSAGGPSRALASREPQHCHILCSASPKFPCMRGDLPAECSLTRATIQNRETARQYE